jgi:hypothetical protein
MTFRPVLTAVAFAVAAGAALAKIPPPVLDEAAKAKAAEAAAKTAWQGKLDAYQLCKAQDKVVANYRKTMGGAIGKEAKGKAAAAMPAASAAPAAAAAPMPVPTAATASQGGSTPVPVAAVATPTPCSDPGPFAYAPPAQKPLETSGAHSPAATATSPPSVKTPSADMAPAKPSTAPAAAKKS